MTWPAPPKGPPASPPSAMPGMRSGSATDDSSAPSESRNETADRSRNETDLERLDRNLQELTGELRVVVTGVQVLFAFLLTVPFATGFAHVGAFERAVYFVTLVLAALSAVCTIAPSARHRLLFRHDDKRDIVFRSNRVAIVGLAFLALAMCGCLLLVTTKLFGVAAGAIAACLGVLPFALLWFALPLSRARALDRRDRERGGGGG